MGEAASTVFTVLLFIAAFLGSGAYAVLSMADFRAARRGFWATALSFAAIGLVLGIMTSWPLPIRIVLCASFLAIAGGGLIWVLDYLKVRESLGIAAPLLDQNEQLQGMLTGGDSYCFFGLYYFDTEKNIAKNIAVVRQGKYPLYDVRMRILDMDTKKDVFETYIGEISGGGTSRAVELKGVWPLQDSVYYRIFFSGRNGLWHEDLLLKKSVKEKYWPAAMRVISGSGKIQHEDVDKKYVEEFGLPQWRP